MKRAGIEKKLGILIGILLVLLAVWMLQKRERFPRLPEAANETDLFRTMRLTEDVIDMWDKLSAQTDDSRWRILSVLMASSAFCSGDREDAEALTLERYDALSEFYESRQAEELALLEQSYETLLSDLVYFPVMKSSLQRTEGIAYADSWLADRAYRDSSHLHEGTDIMALNNERGYYPIVSMTDGVVEQLGWLEKGGYRVGIRSPHGAYFYYAHLYRYADRLQQGDSVKAGQLLGYMGDSGYSKVEGTVGNFDVHLHLGIYLETEHFEEISVNPYWILKGLEQKVVTGAY